MKIRHIIVLGVFTVILVAVFHVFWDMVLEDQVAGAANYFFDDYDLSHGISHAIESLIVVAMVLSVAVFVVNKTLKNVEAIEEKVRVNENRYRAIFSNASSAIILLDLHEKYIQVNERWAEMIGYEVDEIVGMTALDFTHPDDIEKTIDYQMKLINRDIDLAHFEKRYIRKDGTVIWGDLGVAVILDEDGNVINLVCIIQDISQQKKVEETLRLSETRHRDFASDVAHELRTPLAILRANIDQVQDMNVAVQLRQDVDSMSRMVEQLLIRTRLDTLKLNQGETTDLRRVGTRIATQLAPLALKEGRTIEMVGAENPVYVFGNGDALDLAVRNLVENAIKYSARGSTITIEITDVPLLRVIDRGRGIPVEQREAIFTRFLRADLRGGGAGLGLSIVQKTVEAHNGRIDVSDTPGGGSVFTIQLNGAPAPAI